MTVGMEVRPPQAIALPLNSRNVGKFRWKLKTKLHQFITLRKAPRGAATEFGADLTVVCDRTNSSTDRPESAR